MPGTGTEPKSSASEVKVKNVKAVCYKFISKHANFIYLIVCFSVYLVFFFFKEKTIGRVLKRKGTIEY